MKQLVEAINGHRDVACRRNIMEGDFAVCALERRCWRRDEIPEFSFGAVEVERIREPAFHVVCTASSF